jgi:hypothetical protein
MTPSPKTRALEALIEAHATELKLLGLAAKRNSSSRLMSGKRVDQPALLAA